jgi:hypothetical protein
VWRSRPRLGLNASSPLSRGGGVLRHRLRATAFLGFFQARQVERTVDKRDVKQASESKRGQHNQSSEPLRAMSAAASQPPISA